MNIQKLIDRKKLIDMGGMRETMPHKIRPMFARNANQPFSDPNWLFEIKWDGYRAIAEINPPVVYFYSRNFLLFQNVFPQIFNDLKKIKNKMILDGEIIAVDDKGKTSFQNLQNYSKNGFQKIFLVFDLLYYGNFNLTKMPLQKRKKILKEVLPQDLPHIKFNEHIENWGEDFFREILKNNLEGMVGKEKNSLYYPGIRTKNWLKIKNILEEEAVICGYTLPQKSRNYFGSLIMGTYKNNKLIYKGNVGTGFNEESLKYLYKIFQNLQVKESPFKYPLKIRDVIWIKPILVCKIKFKEITQDGLYRHPVFLGLRFDKFAKDINT